MSFCELMMLIRSESVYQLLKKRVDVLDWTSRFSTFVPKTQTRTELFCLFPRSSVSNAQIYGGWYDGNRAVRKEEKE